MRERQPSDVGSYQIEVVVWAKHYRAREEQIDEAAALIDSYIRLVVEKYIAQLVDVVVPFPIKSFVYILLCPAGFAESS
ncbi:MAG: hypothetical protein BMS9Abin34_024 [Patescibacteria group bacterium]|nr:MAG: hypothetical protein BMS9Abin34_024 [Patescibacteria group bacterium]